MTYINEELHWIESTTYGNDLTMIYIRPKKRKEMKMEAMFSAGWRLENESDMGWVERRAFNIAGMPQI